jgi:hypothetical protein
VVRTTLEPQGYILVAGELWHARTLRGRVEAGTNVRVVAIEGLTLEVLPADAEEFLAPTIAGATDRGRWHRVFRSGAH